MDGELTVKIAGEAGQGMKTIGMALCRVFRDAGLHVFANLDYMSRIRGGNNFFQIRAAGRPLETLRENADILVCLDRPSIERHEASVAASGRVVVDKEKFGLQRLGEKYSDIPFYRIAQEEGGSEIYINSAACGIVACLAGIGIETVEKVLRGTFGDKEEEVVSRNVKVARRAYEAAREKIRVPRPSARRSRPKAALLMNGNEAIALGAIHAGCRFYCAYPMTPSTSIMTTVARFADRFGIVVEQAEDEIAAVNMVIGASFAGARAMAATSGGGFALMQEGVSLAAMTETPLVVAEVQRPAPATGFPTRTEQADLDFVLHAGHGEFAKVVFTPGTIEECFALTVRAFDLADKYQIPVFILSDQHLADSIRNVRDFIGKTVRPGTHVLSREASAQVKGYKRYALTRSGVSPRALPSWIDDVIYADSDEHTEEGHITEDGAVRVKMVAKRLFKKTALLQKEIEGPRAFQTEKARTVFVGFGSTCGVLKEAVASARNKRMGFIHLPQVWPFPAKRMTALLRGAKRVVTVENNASGQLAKLITRETARAVDGSILKFDGRPFSVDELGRRLLEEAR
ncbi:MAG: 2-oxoacid:acceptor oxidoreductase subunit alpha [Deltaproteobacteria bacterium]